MIKHRYNLQPFFPLSAPSVNLTTGSLSPMSPPPYSENTPSPSANSSIERVRREKPPAYGDIFTLSGSVDAEEEEQGPSASSSMEPRPSRVSLSSLQASFAPSHPSAQQSSHPRPRDQPTDTRSLRRVSPAPTSASTSSSNDAEYVV